MPSIPLTTIDKVQGGHFFAVKDTKLGDVVYRKATMIGSNDHVRMSDDVVVDPTFGPGSIVKPITVKQAEALVVENRAGRYAEATPAPAKASPELMRALDTLLGKTASEKPYSPPAFFIKDGGTTKAGQLLLVINPDAREGDRVVGKRRSMNRLTSALVSCTDRAAYIEYLKGLVANFRGGGYFEQQLREHEYQLNFYKSTHFFKVESWQSRADLAHKALRAAISRAERDEKHMQEQSKYTGPIPVTFATATFPGVTRIRVNA